MEQRSDFINSQADLIQKILKRLIEKILQLKATDLSISEIEHILITEPIENESLLTVEILKDISDEKLLALLTEKYSYSSENLKTLGDVLYRLYKLTQNQSYGNKALILYNSLLTRNDKTLDFYVITHITELSKLQDIPL